MRPCNVGPRQTQRHHILQLIAETERATHLVEAGAGPEPTTESLINQPTIHHHIERAIRRLHLDCIEDVLPLTFDLRECCVQIGLAVFFDELDSILSGFALTEQYDDFGRLDGSKRNAGLEHAAGIHAGSDTIAELRSVGESPW